MLQLVTEGIFGRASDTFSESQVGQGGGELTGLCFLGCGPCDRLALREVGLDGLGFAELGLVLAASSGRLAFEAISLSIRAWKSDPWTNS